jgi:hypothetical protein
MSRLWAFGLRMGAVLIIVPALLHLIAAWQSRIENGAA